MNILDLKVSKLYCPVCKNWYDVNINATNRLSDFSTGTCIEHTCTRSNGRINFMCTVEKGETADEDLLRAKIHFNYFCSKDVWCQYRTKVSDINIDTHEELIRIPFDLYSLRSQNPDYHCIACYRGDDCPLKAYPHRNLEFLFRFDHDDFLKWQWMENKKRQKEVKEEPQNETIATTKEEDNMNKNKKVTIKEQLWEHSPKENFDIFKNWCSKYNDTFRWAIPVVCIYGAYKILNSKKSEITVDNVAKESKKSLGVAFDCLKDKKALKDLLALGGITATVVVASKAFSSIYKKGDTIDVNSISAEDIEDGLDKLEKSKEKFGFIQPKTEKLLPVATSVIIVYLMSCKPEWLEKAKEKVSVFTDGFTSKVSTYVDLAKLFIADKFHIDLEDEEQNKKVKTFTLLAGIVAVAAILYGRQVLGKKAIINEENASNKNEMLDKFIQQVIGIMKKLMPTAFAGLTTFLVAKHVLKDDDDIIDVSGFEDDFKEDPIDDSEKEEESEEKDTDEKTSEEDDGVDSSENN